MGLISKIEDKLSGNSHKNDASHDSKHGDSNSHSTTGGTSLNHPTSRAEYGASGITGGTMAGGVPSAAHGQSVHGSNVAGSHGSNTQGGNIPGSYPDDSTHGSSNTHRSHLPGTHSSSNTRENHIPGTHGSNNTRDSQHTGTHSSSNTHQGAHIPGTSQGTHQQTSTFVGPSSTDRSTARKPFDPYSSEGQRTAADAAEGRTSHDEYGVNRSRDGGITNQGFANEGRDLVSGPHKDLQNPSAIPTAGGQKVGDGGSGGAYDSSQHQQHGHHTGRDAALGAGAVGAASGHHGGVSDSQHNAPQTNTGFGQNVSYMNRPAADTPLAQEPSYAQRHGDLYQGVGQQQLHQTGQHSTGGIESGQQNYGGTSTQSGHQHLPGHQEQQQGYQSAQHNVGSGVPGSQSQVHQQSGMAGAASGLTTEKKLGGAYEAGYRDAVEHLRAEMQHQGK